MRHSSFSLWLKIYQTGLGLACMASAGCVDVSRFTTPLPPSSQAEAASTHVGVVGVARWDDYVDALQPAFKLTEDQALQKAIPITASYQSKLVEAVRLGLQLGLPTTTETLTQTRNTDAAGQVTRSESEQHNEGPGTLPSPVPPIAQVPAAGSLQLPAISGDQDSFLQYNVATDLLQEVKILNRSVRDARLRQNADAYFIRMKVAVIPFRRGLEYDAYTDIILYVRPSDSAPGMSRSLPTVVPLLVTDNLESANNAAVANAVAEFGAAISAPVGNIAAAAQLQALNDSLTAGATTGRNALQTVARLGENAIRVRFGATLQVDERGRPAYELLPRTHTLSLLVLVPKPARGPSDAAEPSRLSLISTSKLKNARNGDQLPLGRSYQFNSDLQFIADRFSVSKRLSGGGFRCESVQDKSEEKRTPFDWINGLRSAYVATGDYIGFREAADCVFNDGNSPMTKFSDSEDLWTALLSFTGDYAVAGQVIDLPPSLPEITPSASSVVLLADDGKSATIAKLAGTRGLNIDDLSISAIWHGDHQLAAYSVSGSAGAVLADFPSFEKIGLAKDGKIKPDVALLVEGKAKDAHFSQYVDSAHLIYLKEESQTVEQASVLSDVQATRIVTTNGEGKLSVGIQLKPGKPPQKAFVRLAGGEVVESSAGQRDALGRVEIERSMRIQLSLRNLSPGGQVAVAVGLLDGKGNEIAGQTRVLDVIGLPISTKAN